MMLRNKKGAFSDLFIFMIFAFIIVLFSGIFLYISDQTNSQLQDTLGQMELHDTIGNNASQVITNTMGSADQSFQALQWIAVFLIIGMILSIWIGSYLVTTKPIFFVPYLFIVIIAIVVSVTMSNAYEELINTPTLASTYAGFTGANYIMLNLPVWITIIGIAGGIIMFSRMGKKEDQYYG